MQILSKIKALADETRLRIVSLLDRHELNVNEIASMLNMGQSRISRHLKILADSGLVEFRRDGLWVFYKISGSEPELIRIINGQTSGEPVYLEDMESLKRFLSERDAVGREYFNRVAENWSLIRNEITGGSDLNSLITGLADGSRRIADLGCGNGELLRVLLEKGSSVIGIDRSPRMIEEAKKYLARTGSGDFDLRLGELEHLPVREGEVDCAVISMVLHYLDDPASAIEETGRVLNPGGAIIIAETGPHSNEAMRTGFGHRWLGFDRNLVGEWLTGAGFSEPALSSIDGGRGMEINIYHSRKL